MQVASILSAAARNGVSVEQSKHNTRTTILRKGDKWLAFYTQDGYVSHITLHDPSTDAMTDLFMDTYYRSIKEAMHYLNPTGELVKPVRVIDGAAIVAAVDGVQVSKNEEKQGIEIRFPSKPSAEVINTLKAQGFRWSGFNGVWWKKYSPDAMAWAETTFMSKNSNTEVSAMVIEEEAILASAT